MFAPRLGYEALLWETPLEVLYSLEHAHLWIEGQNTQGQVNMEDVHGKISKVKEKYDAKHG